MSASSSRASSRPRGRRRRSSAHSVGSSSMRLLDRHDYTYAVAESSLSEWLKCPICLCPFVEPVRSPVCEHVFCKACLEQHLQAGRKQDDDNDDDGGERCGSGGQCPTCRAHFHASRIRPAAALIRNMVDALLVKCPHAVRGCTHTCERGLVDGHARRECGWMYVGEYDDDDDDAAKGKRTTDLQRGRASPGRCECGSKVLRKDWQAHITSGECAVERVACPYAEGDDGCGAWLKESVLDEHTLDCPARPTQCTYCHALMRQGMLDAHGSTCNEADVICPMSQFGCTWHGRRGDLGDAAASAAPASSHLAQCTLWPLRAFLQQTEAHTSSLERENSRLVSRLDAMEQEQASVKSLVERCVRALGSSFVVPPSHEHAEVAALPISLSPTLAASIPAAARRGRAGSSLAVPSSESRQAPFSTSPSIERLSLAHASAPATSIAGETEFPWQWPDAEFGSTTTAAAVASPPASYAAPPDHDASTMAAVTVSGALEQVHATLASMAERIMTIERRLDDVHGVSLNASFEASRAHEELNSVRHGMHSVRLQMHSLLMQQQMERTLPGQMYAPTAGAASSAMRASSNEGQQPLGATAGGPSAPVMMGLRRFWTGFEQTKL